jgi:hypothetical protein
VERLQELGVLGLGVFQDGDVEVLGNGTRAYGNSTSSE